MDREYRGFAFLQVKFQQIRMENLKAGIINSLQKRELMKETRFDEELSKADLSAWQSLKSVVKNFLGNHRSAELEKEIEELLKSFHQLGARMSVKLHFLQSLLDYFPKSCGHLSEEQGERVHEDICIMEERYQGRWDVNFLADCCWCLKQHAVAAEHRRKSLQIPFIHYWFNSARK